MSADDVFAAAVATTEAREADLRSLLGEGIHTAFRKGCDSPQAHPIWKLIDEMPPQDWDRYLNHLLWSLRASGVIVALVEP